MKKGRVVSMPTTPEAQIKMRARNLPIDKCYINEEWEENQMANVVVTRKHVNGNITYGFYLVDLLLLGVKDCFYAFNESPVELREKIEYEEFVECDYVLAHNIIYEGIAFAEDYGFAPAKDFTKTGIYILEEDSDAIPELDIPLGKSGCPVVLVTSHNPMKQELSILDKTAGPGNYFVYHVNDDGDIEEEDYDFDDDDFDDDELFYDDIITEIVKTGIDNYTRKYTDLSPLQIMALTDTTYYMRFGSPDSQLVSIMKLILGDRRFDSDLANLPGLEPFIAPIQPIIVDLGNNDEDAALKKMEALVASYPDDPDLGIVYINLLRDIGMKPEVEQQSLYWYNRLPDYYAVRLMYAVWLAEQERYDEMFELFGNYPGLDAITTEDKPFTDVMVAEFCACYILAFLAEDKVKEADPYYHTLIKVEATTQTGSVAIRTMTAWKQKALIGN